MKIRFLKDHSFNSKGSEIETSEAAAKYLIRVGAAEEVKEVVYFEKEEIAPKKEKKENKTGNIPTAKSRKLSEATIEGIEKDHNVKLVKPKKK